MTDMDLEFKNAFPKLGFTLSELQKKAIQNVSANRNTLCIMPTGAGKSVIYWMSGVRRKGITIVVSPLIALIAEQENKIREHGYEVLAFHGSINQDKQVRLLKDFANRTMTPDFIFVSPEKIATDGLFEYCIKQRKKDISLLVIDEVHCVSQWGLSFRPFYKRIPSFLNDVFGNTWPCILAMTATLNPKELGDICDSFKIGNNDIIKEPLLMRNEIQLHVLKFSDEKEKEEKFWEILNIHRSEKTLVYVYRKKNARGVEDLCERAIEKGYSAAWFHGDMNLDERTDIIEKFKSGQISVVFATNAFGMGIDIRDIRNIIHFMIPESAEQYYQEIGRAARDGGSANAYLLYTNKNIEVKRTYFIDKAFPSEDMLRSVYGKLNGKLGYRVLPYFEDEELQQCLPYYILAGLVEITCKGFADLTGLSEIVDPELKHYFDSTKTKGFCLTVKKCNIQPRHLAESVYQAIVDGNVKVKKPPTHWLVLNILENEIDDVHMQIMLKDIAEKRAYKHDLLNYLVYLLDEKLTSQQLHQELAQYLGTEKHQLARIYTTADGNKVRSKSEVIICNLLAQHNVNYVYEQKLYYGENNWIEPDFTITTAKGKVFYWEHVGMLGKEDYDSRWTKKLEIYDAYFPGQMVKTYESGVISQDATRVIEKLNAAE